MEYLGIHDPDVYAILLSENPEEKSFFESLLPVTITRFFRNAQVWSDFADLLPGPELLSSGQVSDFRLWSACCAGGEEAYTVAMLLCDVFKKDSRLFRWTVLGTDIDTSSLDRSRSAQYRWGAVREVPEHIRNRWFIEEKGTWTLDREVRNMVRIMGHDIVRQDPPGSFHGVFLRNSVLTYNTEQVQRKVLEKIHGCLLEPGLLVIGRTEKVPDGTGFEEIRKCIYRKVEGRK